MKWPAPALCYSVPQRDLSTVHVTDYSFPTEGIAGEMCCRLCAQLSAAGATVEDGVDAFSAAAWALHQDFCPDVGVCLVEGLGLYGWGNDGSS